MDDKQQARRLEVLKSIPLFSEVHESHLTTMIDDFRIREYNRDEIIFRQGDESREVYFIMSGKVRIYKISPGGGETSIDIFSKTDSIGELAAIDRKPRSATAKAISDVSLLTMSHDRFLHHLKNVPGLALGLAQLLSQRLRWTAAFAESVAQFDAAGRLLHILILFNERYGRVLEPEMSYELDLQLTQSDLASMVGARREWVNRLLADWRKRGLIDFERGLITILNLPRVLSERDSRTEANLGGEW